jgi:4-hydroxy-tetrahydrodipicolinate synthase
MRGVWTAIVTPFTDDGQLDLPSLKKMLRNQIDAGITGIIPCGTTGESPTLSHDEKKLLIQTCLSECRGTSVQVVAGTGTHNTQETIEFSQWAGSAGVNGVLVVTPYYSKPSQLGLEKHFEAVASAISCPVILYHVPGRTGVNLAPQTISKLARHPRIRAIKEASGNPTLTSEIIDQLRLDQQTMDVLSGDDATYLPLLSLGAVGVISVASNLFPKAMVQLQKHFDEGNIAGATSIHQKYYPLFRDLFIESNPVPVKAALAEVGWCKPHVRLPLASLTAPHLDRLRQSLDECQIFQDTA